MCYIVKASTPNGEVRWLTTPRLAGHRTFALRDLAEIFQTLEAAQDAINAITNREHCTGLVFTVDSVGDEPSAGLLGSRN